MATHSSTLAENRLHPSGQNHKTTLIYDDDDDPLNGDGDGGKKSVQVAGTGPGLVEPIGAFEVSKGKRILQVGVAVGYCLLSAGVVFGYAALKPVFVHEGVYRDKCSEEEIEKGVRVCYEQEIRLNFMFTVAAVATNVCALLVGTILDQYGPRVSGVIGSVLLALGCLGFGFSEKVHSFDPYPLSYLLLALAGPFVFISSLHLSNTFPTHSGLILSMLTGAFDASSVVFLVYRIVYEKTAGRIGIRQWFLGYLVVPAMIIVAQIFIMPGQSYKTPGELVRQAEVEEELLVEEEAEDSEHEIDDDEIRIRREGRESVLEEIDHLLGGKDAELERERKAEGKLEGSGVWGAMHGKPLKRQLTSWWFILITLFTIIQMTRINYFVATIRSQYEYLLHSYPLSVNLNTFFDISLPLGGLLSIPLIGLLLDNLSTAKVLTLLVTFATAIGILGCIQDSYPAAVAGIVGFVIYRPFYYTAVSDYAAKVFGFRTFGKVYGSIICLAGVFNFSQTGLDTLRYKVFGGNPVPVNLALMGAAMTAGCVLIAYVVGRGSRLRRESLGREAEGAVETLMPGGERGYGGV